MCWITKPVLLGSLATSPSSMVAFKTAGDAIFEIWCVCAWGATSWLALGWWRMLKKDDILCGDVVMYNNGGDSEYRTEAMNDEVQI